MLAELYGKGGTLCGPAKQGELRCPLIVRQTSEDVVTGHLVQALRAINPRWWLPDLLNDALGENRFRRQIYRGLRIEPWVNQPRIPRKFLPWKEGSTQVDVGISWENPPTTVFIEAKYQSGLSMKTTHSNRQNKFPNDQLIRNIRVGLYAAGYFRDRKLFQVNPRDFVVILLTPAERHPLVEEYRNEARLLEAIPHSDKLATLPKTPFIGQLTYAQIQATLGKQRRWFSRSERFIADTLIEYLDTKRDQTEDHARSSRQTELTWDHESRGDPDGQRP